MTCQLERIAPSFGCDLKWDGDVRTDAWGREIGHAWGREIGDVRGSDTGCVGTRDRGRGEVISGKWGRGIRDAAT